MEAHRTVQDSASDEREKQKDGPEVANKEHDPYKGGETAGGPQDQHAVRFASRVEVEEISPVDTRRGASTVPSEPGIAEEKSPPQPEQGTALQGRRMSLFHFEPMSLPPSRAASNEDSPRDRYKAPSSSHSDRQSTESTNPAMQSPPLTPAGTGHTDTPEKKADSKANAQKIPTINEPQRIPPTITPQQSTSREGTPPAAEAEAGTKEHPDQAKDGHKDQPQQRSDSPEEADHRARSHRRGIFSLGGESAAGSVATSREVSPSRASVYYSRPASPSLDANDPYAASKRPPPEAHPTRKTINPRFHFPARRRSPPRGVGSIVGPDKRHSGLFTALKAEEMAHSSSSISGHSRSSSFATLKRIFKRGGSGDSKRDASPAPSRASSKQSIRRMPFGEDHGLELRYGRFDRMLGSGAGGSVRLLKRDDGTVFAVKEFRARHNNESEKRYNKKVTSEFCIGSALHHGNIIETLDIIMEKDRWYEVMEYAPYDLFSIVMSGKMSREEITCSWLQILNGVTYLHSCGVAHRDLKLDNVVVNERGIMKIIDFGSAHIFQHPLETGMHYAEGVVGSDPYMAPEVYDKTSYDPQACDIWSLAIIFCCMTLRRFPWKIPQKTDKSFRLFAMDPTTGHDPRKLLMQSRSAVDLANRKGGDTKEHGREASDMEPNQRTQSHAASLTTDRREVINGPWRILRLLPRESRHVIWRMLDLNPRRRAKMSEILKEPWVADTVICQQFGDGRVVSASDHTHTLVEPASHSDPDRNY